MNTTESQFIALKYEISYVGVDVVLLPHFRMPHSYKVLHTFYLLKPHRLLYASQAVLISTIKSDVEMQKFVSVIKLDIYETCYSKNTFPASLYVFCALSLFMTG